MTKAWWKSKTMWVNLAALFGTIAVEIQEWVGNLPEGTLPEGALIGVGALTTINLVLRTLTGQPIGLKGEVNEEK